MADNKQNTNSNVPNLRFGEYSDEWNLTELQKVATISKGSGISKDQLSENGTYCILYGELYTKYNSEIISEVYSKTELDAANLVKSKENDVIIPCSGETAIDISTARCVPFNGILLGGDLNIIRLKNQNGGFFAYQLNGKRKVDIAKVAQGVSVVHLYGEHLKRVKIAYPTYSEQKKIADFLSLLDSRIATQNKIIEDLKKLKVAICNKLIDNLVNREPLICFSEIYSKAGEGGTPETSKSEYYENGIIPFIKIDDLSNKYITSNKDFITDLGLQKSSAWIIPTHSLIYSNGATIGAISINTYEVCTKQGILGIVPKTSISVEYLYCLMSSNYFSKQVHRIITHGTMATAYLKDINKIKVPIPCMPQQLEIANTVSSVTNKIETELNILSLLKKQKQYLLQQMFI